MQIILCGWILICARKIDNEMRWEDAEIETGKTRYSLRYRDSVATFFDVGNNRELRSVSLLPLTYSTTEKMVYQGGWGFIKAGYGIFTTRIDYKKDLFHIEGRAVTNNFVSAFYKVRDFICTEIDLNGFYPIFFEQHISEEKYHKSTFVLYDHVAKRVISNKKNKKNKGKRIYKVNPYTHNYLSLLYLLRRRIMAPGDTLSINCFVHGKDYAIKFIVWEREEIKVVAGKFRTLRIEPVLVGEGHGFTKRDKMMLWLTDDDRHIMIKAKSKIKLGSITAELIHYEAE